MRLSGGRSRSRNQFFSLGRVVVACGRVVALLAEWLDAMRLGGPCAVFEWPFLYLGRVVGHFFGGRVVGHFLWGPSGRLLSLVPEGCSLSLAVE